MPGGRKVLTASGAGIEAHVWMSHVSVPKCWLELNSIAGVFKCGAAKAWEDTGDTQQLCIEGLQDSTVEIYRLVKYMLGVASCRIRDACYFGP
jgi:hypothetical protein